jgi:plastocyanin
MRSWLTVVLLASALSVSCDDDSAPPATDLSATSGMDMRTHPTGDASMSASVDINDDFYAPQNVTITKNGTVTWTWRGTNSHSVTNDASSTEIFDSGINSNGHTFMHTFSTAGVFGYHCQIHGSFGMTGTITVQ